MIGLSCGFREGAVRGAESLFRGMTWAQPRKAGRRAGGRSGGRSGKFPRSMIAGLLVLTSLGLFSASSPALASGAGTRAALSADPVIAVAGDIACDPSNPSFNGGNGSSNSCREMYTSSLLLGAGLSAVLTLGDTQYYCGGYSAFLQSYDP